jgi:thiamine transport system substrate-binding protein
MSRRNAAIGFVLATVMLAAACGSSGRGGSGTESTSPTTQKFVKKLVLMTHDSFAVSKPVLAAFEQQTGYEVKVLKSGDAGALVSQAILAKDHPVADALFGIDNTFLTRALDADLFEPYTAQGLDGVRGDLRQEDPQHRVTPIDHANVCINDDRAWFGHDGRPDPPESLADLVKPEYKDLLVVENPVSSSPGLAFLLATIAANGDDGWQDYWQQLRDNGVRVVDGWEEAYYTDFTAGGSGGDRPLVVSYATDPAADVVFSDGKKTSPTVGVVSGTCFAQTEFAGVLANAKNPAGARALIDFMLTRKFQADLPLQMYVYPAVTSTPLPKVFRDFAPPPVESFVFTPDQIGDHRRAWQDEWTQIVLR